MVISKDSWHYQMYKWNRGVVDVPLKSQINLCPYVRTVLIWTPLLWLLFAGKAIPRVYNFFTWVAIGTIIGGYKFYHFDRRGFLAVLAFLAIAAAATGVLAGICYFMERRGKKLITSSPTYQLVAEYAEATHSKICPLLEVERERYPWEPV